MQAHFVLPGVDPPEVDCSTAGYSLESVSLPWWPKRCVNIANVLFVTPCNVNKKLVKTFQLFFYVEDKGLLSGHDLATPEPSVDR